MFRIKNIKIRSAVASVDFDSFHKNSAQIIRKTVFGIESTTNKVFYDLIV